MQSYTAIPSSQTIASSLALLLNNDQSSMSQNSGTAFPTSNLLVGMPCFRTDLNQLYQLTAITPSATWQLVCDFNKTAIFAQDVAANYLPLAGGTLSGLLTLSASGVKFSDGSTLTSAASLSGTYLPLTGGTVTGATTFNVRPTFNSATPWDSANFTPANYAPLAGATFTGVVDIATTTAVIKLHSASTSYAGVQGFVNNVAAFIIGSDAAVSGGTNNLNTAFYTYGNNSQNFYTNGVLQLSISGAGVAAFTQRPTFGSATPWDSANLTPANYAPLAGATFTGAVTFSSTLTASGAATFTSATATSFSTRPTFNGATPWDSVNLTKVSQLTNDASYITGTGVTSLINNTSASADISLAVGQGAYLDISAATSVPLHIATGDLQCYEITLMLNGSTGSTLPISLLLPNNATYTNYFYQQYMMASASSVTLGSSYIGGFYIAADDIRLARIIADTRTASKSVMTQANLYVSGTGFYQWSCISIWNSAASSYAAPDTTTVWSSLGTLTFSIATTGRVIIRRIA